MSKLLGYDLDLRHWSWEKSCPTNLDLNVCIDTAYIIATTWNDHQVVILFLKSQLNQSKPWIWYMSWKGQYEHVKEVKLLSRSIIMGY